MWLRPILVYVEMIFLTLVTSTGCMCVCVGGVVCMCVCVPVCAYMRVVVCMRVCARARVCMLPDGQYRCQYSVWFAYFLHN